MLYNQMLNYVIKLKSEVRQKGLPYHTMSDQAQKDIATTIKVAVEDILKTIDQQREREIITRRFGLYDRKETLEQIGELLGITRERVRQLEKAILIRLKIASEEGKIPAVQEVEKLIIRDLSENGRVAKVQDMAERLIGSKAGSDSKAHLVFIGEISPKVTTISENDNYFQGVGIAEYGDEKKVRAHVDEIVKAIKNHGEPVTIEQLFDTLNGYEAPNQVQALASLSKTLAHLKDMWGLVKWPTVNPKNIRDKIYVILADNGKPMHFSAIAGKIKDSDFKRKDVTTQAIHNELIKDKRFVLIGRGIYALDQWGYDKGTVSDVITDVLKKAGEPLHRDEIVRRVLKSRQVKETTILLNLQSKPEFKRVAKATYSLAEPKA